ncbi:hypothetical protein EJ06DRAFT_113676 [Trichodelitschia bisporula]|uniref:Uncharacterized protein n=1 Tax=Trichodelitschia bisporula TaxID=703511 RepID=A0A6G1HR83_9PEZI|nr:hypothetical protein EJ06DRAFT_113676 [Trichodelitschia bisporula]
MLNLINVVPCRPAAVLEVVLQHCKADSRSYIIVSGFPAGHSITGQTRYYVQTNHQTTASCPALHEVHGIFFYANGDRECAALIALSQAVKQTPVASSHLQSPSGSLCISLSLLSLSPQQASSSCVVCCSGTLFFLSVASASSASSLPLLPLLPLRITNHMNTKLPDLV